MHTIIKAKAFILLTGVAFFTQPLLAQSISDISTELETIVVESGYEGARPYKSFRTSAAVRFVANSLDNPQSVGVVTRKRFEDQMVETDRCVEIDHGHVCQRCSPHAWNQFTLVLDNQQC